MVCSDLDLSIMNRFFLVFSAWKEKKKLSGIVITTWLDLLSLKMEKVYTSYLLLFLLCDVYDSNLDMCV